MDFTIRLTPGQDQKSVGLGFLAHSLVVDNPTAQWWYVPDAFRYVPPYTGGVRYALSSATQSLTILAQTPPGQTSTVIAGELAQAVASDTGGELTGTSFDFRSLTTLASILSHLQYYDRAGQVSVFNSYNAFTVGNHGLTSRWSYTVPSSKAAFIEYVTAAATFTSFSSNAFAYAIIQLNGSGLMMADTATSATGGLAQIGFNQAGSPGLMYLPAGSVLAGYTQNNASPATVDYLVAAKGLEFSV